MLLIRDEKALTQALRDPRGLIVLIDIPFQTSDGKADDDAVVAITSDRIDLKAGAQIPQAAQSAIRETAL